MHFTATLISAAACVSSVMAAPASSTYDLITTHSGNPSVHLHAVGFTESGEVAIDAVNPFTVFFDGDKLGVTGAQGLHGSQVYLQVKENNSVVLNDDGTSGFSLDQSDVALNGQQSFGVCVDDGKLYYERAPSCYNFVGVGLYAAAISL